MPQVCFALPEVFVRQNLALRSGMSYPLHRASRSGWHCHNPQCRGYHEEYLFWSRPLLTLVFHTGSLPWLLRTALVSAWKSCVFPILGRPTTSLHMLVIHH